MEKSRAQEVQEIYLELKNILRRLDHLEMNLPAIYVCHALDNLNYMEE